MNNLTQVGSVKQLMPEVSAKLVSASSLAELEKIAKGREGIYFQQQAGGVLAIIKENEDE